MNKNFFELLNIPVSFELSKEFEHNYFELQKKHHPDKVQNNVIAKITEAKISSKLNEAYNVLKNPLSRAEYILDLLGIKLVPSSELLMEVMEMHEEGIIYNEGDILSELQQAFGSCDYEKASQLTMKWRYLIRGSKNAGS